MTVRSGTKNNKSGQPNPARQDGADTIYSIRNLRAGEEVTHDGSNTLVASVFYFQLKSSTRFSAGSRTKIHSAL